jgi:hypothetical protein
LKWLCAASRYYSNLPEGRQRCCWHWLQPKPLHQFPDLVDHYITLDSNDMYLRTPETGSAA